MTSGRVDPLPRGSDSGPICTRDVVYAGRWMGGRVDGRTDRQTDKRTDGRTDGRAGGREGGREREMEREISLPQDLAHLSRSDSTAKL